MTDQVARLRGACAELSAVSQAAQNHLASAAARLGKLRLTHKAQAALQTAEAGARRLDGSLRTVEAEASRLVGEGCQGAAEAAKLLLGRMRASDCKQARAGVEGECFECRCAFGCGMSKEQCNS